MLAFRSYPFILLLFQFCSGCPASYLVLEQTLIYLKPHRRTRKVKKIIAVFLIPSNHNSDPQEVSAITSSVPITPATSNFVVQRHHNDDPAFRWPSAHLLQSTPDHLRQPASPNPDPCQCCTTKSPTSCAPLPNQTLMQI